MISSMMLWAIDLNKIIFITLRSIQFFIKGFHKNIELVSSCFVGLGNGNGKRGSAREGEGGEMDKEHTRGGGGRYSVIWSNTSGLVASSISGKYCE